MDGDPVELDEHRGMAAQKSTEIRRCGILCDLFPDRGTGMDGGSNEGLMSH